MGSFVFPFALADSAIAEMEDLASRVRGLIDAHDRALTDVHVDFDGQTRDQFDRELSTQLDQLQAFARALDGDAGELRQTIARAHWLDALAAEDAS